MTHTKFKNAYTTLTTRTFTALGKNRTRQLCNVVEDGLSVPCTERQIDKLLKAIKVDAEAAVDLKTAFKGTPALVLDTLVETWRPRTRPTRCDVFFQIKDVQYQIIQTIERIQYEIRTTTQPTGAR